MTVRRKQIPSDVEDDVLFMSDHTCCICRTKGKDVQIHHIDSTSANNSSGNLAVVCLDCHSRITGRRGLGRSYTPGEVRRYKRNWEQHVLASRRVHRPSVRYRRELISQIDLIVCEVLACRKDSPRVRELLDLLWELHLWRGNREIDARIIEGLGHLAIMSGLSSPPVAAMVAEKLWEMCCHFVGPDKVPMESDDVERLLECIRELGTLASFNCEFGHGRRATDVISEQAQNFFEIGLWYSRNQILNAVIRVYKDAIQACYTDGRLEFRYGRLRLRKSLRNVQRMLRDRRSHLPRQELQLEQLLKM